MSKAIVTLPNGQKATAAYVEAERNAKGRLVATGKLKRGLKIGTDLHRDFELQEALTEDLLIAERAARRDTPLNYNAEVLSRQLIRIGTFDGPFSSVVLGPLRAFDLDILLAAQAELDTLGEVIE